MLKVKVLRFTVSNSASVHFPEDERQSWFKEEKARLCSEADVERKINNFIKNKNVVDIKVNNVDVRYHNNARGNAIDLIYTVLYKE